MPRNTDTNFPSKEAILDYLKDADGKTTRRDIARHFDIKGDDRTNLRGILKELENQGTIEKDRNKQLRPAGVLPPVLPADIMSIDEDGNLLAIPSMWRAEEEPPQIVIPLKEAQKKKPAPGIGDRILARLTQTSSNRYNAKIIRVLGKGSQRLLGVFKKARFGGIVDPIDRRAKSKLTVDKDDTRGAKDGDLVWVETIKHSGGSTRARVREITGHVDDRAAYSLIALVNHSIPVEFPESVIEEAGKVPQPSAEGRQDLRELPLLTIDPFDAKDHDDAIWAKPDDASENKGGFKVIVAIADVSWFVRPGSLLDREALKRGNSTYLPDRVVPMLPERLSNDLCSLMDGVDRPCLAVEITLDSQGRKTKHSFMRAVMRSAASLSYEDAQGFVTSPTQGEIPETVTHLFNAYKARLLEREKRAPLDLELPERKIVLKEDGTVARVERRERFDAHKLVEEFMILANVAAAETLEKAKVEQIYRVHDKPDPERLEGVRDYLGSLDYSLIKGGSLRPQHFNQLLSIADSRDQKEMVSEIVLRSQQQAVYAIENLGHFGLNLARYSHFTSPIRRYADLTIHRALVRACSLGEGAQSDEEAAVLGNISSDISDLERRSMAAERESKDRYLAGYLEDRVGDEFAARIRGVTRFGLFVMLDDSGADGFIPMRSIGHERYELDEARHAVVGQSTGDFFQLGQAVEVRLAEATPISGGLRFDLLTDPQSDPDFKKSGKAKYYTRKGSRHSEKKTRKPSKAERKKKKSSRGKANAKPRSAS